MKNALKLIGSIVVCEVVGISGTPFTIAAIPTWYATLSKPYFSPPNWLFGPVWTILYFLMGVSFFLIWKQGLKKKKNKTAAVIFGIQLLLNFLWTVLFFGLKSPVLGLIGIILLLVSIGLTMQKFYGVSKLAAYLLIPYLVWVCFATLLNISIVILN
jgi:tryptophan-rich sensory protein